MTMSLDDIGRLKELQVAMLKAIREIQEYIASHQAPDAEVRTWPLFADGESGIWCGDANCPLEAENSEIGDFREGSFTADELLDAIAQHIDNRREREDET